MIKISGIVTLKNTEIIPKSKNELSTPSSKTIMATIENLSIVESFGLIKKIIRSSISDLICKGIKPKYYFISGSGNKESFSKLNLSRISKSLNQEQNKYKIKKAQHLCCAFFLAYF